MLTGGDGNDVMTGGAGTDEVFGQGGNDQMIWNPGDGSDVVEGQAGSDTWSSTAQTRARTSTFLPMAAASASARDVGNVDHGLERHRGNQPQRTGRADTITVNDLTGTDVQQA